MITETRDVREINPYEALAVSIVRKAIEDWFLAKDLIAHFPYRKDEGEKLLWDCEKFFKSKWYETLTGNVVSGEQVLEQLELQWEREGKIPKKYINGFDGL